MLAVALVSTGVIVILTTSLFGFSPTATHASAPSLPGSTSGPAAAPPRWTASLSAQSAGPSSSEPATSAPTFNPPCFQITKSTCVRICTPTTPGVVPTGVNHTATVQPLYTQNIYLCVFSEKTLLWAPTGVPTSGPHSPVTLNVTGVLWNGDPYMSMYDHTEYHSDSNTWYTVDNTLSGTNATYPYVYDVTIWNRSNGSSGNQNFFPGETVSWWIQIVNYTNASGYLENRSVVFSYRIAGAWAFSPHEGAGQYAGTNASTGDLSIRWSPLAPNWNDTVNVSISVTAADVTNLSAIGTATLIIERFSGTQLVGNATYRPFPIGTFINATGVSIKGNETANTTIPNTLTQIAGDTLDFWVVAQDNAFQNDTISLPMMSIYVNGNGSFSSGVFSDDIAVASSPPSVANPAVNATTLQIVPALVAPGENVTVTVQSRSTATSLFSALIVYTLSYAPLHEVASAVVNLGRVNSTTFRGSIPGMPVNSSVNFTILAFDYTHHLDESSPFSYTTPSLSSYVAVVPSNDSFFYVYVYDNGSHAYVTGALIQIRGLTPGFNTVSSTRFGIAYPNATGNYFVPLLVAANSTYNISVTAPAISAGNGGHLLSVDVYATNVMRTHTTLARGDDYFVVEEGNSIYFWVNGTVPATVFSPPSGPSGAGVQLAALIALIATAVMAFVLYRWFDQIQKRRKAEERRVTL
ncbi:MAG TPA: hypothetical protein VGS23_00170 [Thermoplasmata archaeon]|nr:hypothetical protein [Thermoplasmata archaeon]